MVLSQVCFPTFVSRIGEFGTCTCGILLAGAGITGMSVVRFQPFHTMLYMVQRTGASVADTATASLVARESRGEERSRNLAMLTSTRAAARIVSPLACSKLFEISSRSTRHPGALPFLIIGGLAILISPLPRLIKVKSRK
ncbi:hypothetical protein TrVE_jg13190 [Triparma verrucosa]|nr:hypothetical protein TrVE_jg13190 [Triparma verrucosa]